MKVENVIRAWKDQSYRRKLTAAQQAELPAHPSGMIELTEADLGMVSGGAGTVNCETHQVCTATHWWVCTYHPCS